MRQSGKTPGDIRQGLLGAMSSGAGRLAALLITAAALLCTLGCEEKTVRLSPVSSSPELKDGMYRFSGDFFTPAESLPGENQHPLLPWTSQVRGAGCVESGSYILLGVNRKGVLVFSVTGDGLLPAASAYQPEIFAENTLGGVFRQSDSVILHIYRNTFFDPPRQERTISPLVSFSPVSGQFEEMKIPFAGGHLGWEAVDILSFPKGSGESGFMIAWKHTAEDATEFLYSAYFPETREEKKINQEEFRSAYIPSPLVGAPNHLSELWRICLMSEKETVFSEKKGYEILLSSSSGFRHSRYFQGSQEDLSSGFLDLMSFDAYWDGRFSYLLVGNTIFWRDEEGVSGEISLPELPRNFAYTGFWCNSKTLLVLWEEQKQHFVGDSGFYLKTISLGF